MFARTLLLSTLAVSTLCSAQNPLKAYPQNYKLVLDGPQFAVLRVHYCPHEQVGMHDHSAFSTVYVYLYDSGPVRVQHTEEAKPFDAVRPPNTPEPSAFHRGGRSGIRWRT